MPPLALAEAAPCSFDSRKKAESFSQLEVKPIFIRGKTNQDSGRFPVPSNDDLSSSANGGIEDLAAVLQGRQSVYEIFEANKPMLAHPDKIYPGQALWIP